MRNLTRNQLLALLHQYDAYIQRANDENKYDTGWRPVCIEEFFDSEFIDDDDND